VDILGDGWVGWVFSFFCAFLFMVVCGYIRFVVWVISCVCVGGFRCRVWCCLSWFCWVLGLEVWC